MANGAGPRMTTAENRRVAAYCRVSTGGQTVENQRRALEAYAGARGWLTTWFLDEGGSGARERRPGLDALLLAAQRPPIELVLCVKPGRLARAVHHLLA